MDNFKTQHKFRFNNDFFFNPVMLDNFCLYQAGDLYCEYDTLIEEHKQDVQIELSFVENGSGKMYTNGVPSVIKKGDIYLSIKGDIHKVTSDTGDTVRFFYIAFDVNPSSPFFAIAELLQERYNDPKERVFKLKSIFYNITTILSEISCNAEYSLQMIETELSQILISLFRHCNHIAVDYDIIEKIAKNSLVHNLVHYVDSHFIEMNDLTQLSKKFAYSYMYMSKKFKQAMGKSLCRYVTEKRLNHGAYLIFNEKRSVTYVSNLLEYSSISNFSRAFKNYFGYSPQNCEKAISPPPKKLKLKRNQMSLYLVPVFVISKPALLLQRAILTLLFLTMPQCSRLHSLNLKLTA